MDQAKTLGGEIRQRRLELGLSQTDLANLIGSKQPHISRLESNVYPPTLIDAREIAKALGMDPLFFLEAA